MCGKSIVCRTRESALYHWNWSFRMCRLRATKTHAAFSTTFVLQSQVEKRATPTNTCEVPYLTRFERFPRGAMEPRTCASCSKGANLWTQPRQMECGGPPWLAPNAKNMVQGETITLVGPMTPRNNIHRKQQIEYRFFRIGDIQSLKDRVIRM